MLPVAFPGFYLLSEKIGMSLGEAHKPVPYFNEKLLKSVERTLKRFEPHQPFERTSWGERWMSALASVHKSAKQLTKFSVRPPRNCG